MDCVATSAINIMSGYQQIQRCQVQLGKVFLLEEYRRTIRAFDEISIKPGKLEIVFVSLSDNSISYYTEKRARKQSLQKIVCLHDREIAHVFA